MFARFLSVLVIRLKSTPWKLLGVVALAVICLKPTLGTGYLSDDNVSSLTPGMLKYAGKGFTQWVLDAIWSSTQGGRFYPLHWPAFYGVFEVIQDVYAYKIFIVVCVIINLLLFMALIRKMGGDQGLATLAASLTVLAFQLRAFHDPILSFFGLLQFVFAGSVLSLLALELYLVGKGARWLAVSTILYLGCCLMYELSYPFFAIHALRIAQKRPGWRAWARSSLPFVIASAACVLASLLARKFATQGAAEIYKTGFEPGAAFSTLARQTVSALPLSYFVIDPASLFWGVKNPRAILSWLSQPEAIGVMIAAAFVCWLGLRRLGEDRRNKTSLVGFGVLLAILPAVMISITKRYQAEVSVGNGYVPVYIQYFGVALLLASATQFLLAKWPRGIFKIGFKTVVIGVVGLATGLTYQANVATAVSLVSPPGTATFNATASGMGGGYHYHRLNLEAALKAGLMDDVPEHARVFLSNEYPWWYEGLFSAFFFAKGTGKEFVTIPPSARDLSSPKAVFLKKVLAHRAVLQDPAFHVRDVCSGPTSGYVVLSQDGQTGDLRLFVRHPHLFSRSRSIPSFLVSADSRAADGLPYLKPARDLHLLKSGSDWAVFALREDSNLVAADTVRPVFDRAEGARLAEARDRAGLLQAQSRQDIIAR